MKTGVIMAVVILALILTGAVILYSMAGQNDQSLNGANSAGGTMLTGTGDYNSGLIGGDAAAGTGSTGTETTHQTFTVEVTSSGFSPKTLEISKGDTVTWVNKGSASVWPASDNHPTHNIYPGFDAKRGLKTGETYSFTFDKVGTWGYHDHLSSSDKGTIVVK